MASGEIINASVSYLKLLKDNGIHVHKAWLYGSYARGDNNPESDIDLLIVSSDFDNPEQSTIGLVWRLTRLINSRIEPYLVGLNKFENDDISPILQIVRKEGILLND